MYFGHLKEQPASLTSLTMAHACNIGKCIRAVCMIKQHKDGGANSL